MPAGDDVRQGWGRTRGSGPGALSGQGLAPPSREVGMATTREVTSATATARAGTPRRTIPVWTPLPRPCSRWHPVDRHVREVVGGDQDVQNRRRCDKPEPKAVVYGEQPARLRTRSRRPGGRGHLPSAAGGPPSRRSRAGPPRKRSAWRQCSFGSRADHFTSNPHDSLRTDRDHQEESKKAGVLGTDIADKQGLRERHDDGADRGTLNAAEPAHDRGGKALHRHWQRPSETAEVWVANMPPNPATAPARAHTTTRTAIGLIP